VHGQALAGEYVDDGEHPEPARVGQAVLHEVHAPALIRSRGLGRDDPQVAVALRPLLGPNAQPFQLVEAVDPLVV